MKEEILPKAIYVRVSTKEQATVIQNGLSFSRFLFMAVDIIIGGIRNIKGIIPIWKYIGTVQI